MSKFQEPWVIRESPIDDDVFIQAKKLDPNHPYDIEVMGDDTGELYPDKIKRAHAERIVALINAATGLSTEEAVDKLTNKT